MYSVRLKGDDAFIWVHVEHQSTPDRFMALRMVNYQSGQMLSHIYKNTKIKKLPTIISLVYHQGTAPYPYSLDLKDIFIDPILGMQYFGKPILVDLPAMPDDTLEKHDKIAPAELVMKYIRLEEFKKNYRWLIVGLKLADDASRRVMIPYMIERSDGVSPDELMSVMIENLPEDKEVIMTCGEQLRHAGRIEGAVQERRALAKQLMQRLQDVAKVADLMNLSVFEVQDLLKH